MKRATYCLVCGSIAPAEAARCPSCDAPLRNDRRGRRPPRRAGRPSVVTVLCVLAGIALLMAFVAYVMSG